MMNKQVDTYIENAAAFAQPILRHLRDIVHEVCPEVEETWKWSFPNFMYKGAILCSMAAFKQHCAFNFWKAAVMEDPDDILATTDRVGMGNLGKITCLADLPADAILKKYLKMAMILNENNVKARAKPKDTAKKELIIPAYFTDQLETNNEARAAFEKFPYSHKREYVEWFEEAKTEATRNKRMAQALQWLAEGKSRNWKY